MKTIVNHKRTKVFFDNKKNEYIKIFNPKPKSRLKFFLGFRKYPGENFKYISEVLKKLGINVPKIKFASKYTVVTENIEGELLSEYIKKDSTIIIKFLDLIVKVLNNNIYFGDFNTTNFIIKNEEIYALDLEDYRKEIFFSRDSNEALIRLERTLKNKKWVEYVKNNLNF
jgi:RIO-like serine/threonine protein kinase